MRPGTKLERRVDTLAASVKDLTPARREWGLSHIIPHYCIYRTRTRKAAFDRMFARSLHQSLFQQFIRYGFSVFRQDGKRCMQICFVQHLTVQYRYFGKREGHCAGLQHSEAKL